MNYEKQFDRFVTKLIKALVIACYVGINITLWVDPRLREVDGLLKVLTGLFLPPFATILIICGVMLIVGIAYGVVKFFSADNFFENDSGDMM